MAKDSISNNRHVNETPNAMREISTHGFILRDLGQNKFWLVNAAGEGLETTGAKIDQLLGQFFEKEF